MTTHVGHCVKCWEHKEGESSFECLQCSVLDIYTPRRHVLSDTGVTVAVV